MKQGMTLDRKALPSKNTSLPGKMSILDVYK